VCAHSQCAPVPSAPPNTNAAALPHAPAPVVCYHEYPPQRSHASASDSTSSSSTSRDVRVSALWSFSAGVVSVSGKRGVAVCGVHVASGTCVRRRRRVVCRV